jgi:hypothetical protein
MINAKVIATHVLLLLISALSFETHASDCCVSANRLEISAGSTKTLKVGETLRVGSLSFVMQEDSNFVAYKNGKAVWAIDDLPQYRIGAKSGTSHTVLTPSKAYTAVFQSDGNIVLYGPQGAYWASASSVASGSHFVLSDSPPFIEVRDSGNRQVWVATEQCETFHGNSADLQTFLDQYFCANLPVGTYVLDKPLHMRDHQHLVGADQDKTILRAAPATWQFSGTDSVIVSVGSTRSKVENLTIDASGVATYAAASSGMSLNQLKMINGRCSSVGITGPAMSVTNSEMAYNARTTNVPGRGSINCASGNFGGVALGAAIYAEGAGNEFSPIITHNKIHSNVGPALDINGVWGGTFSDNTVYDNQGWAAVSLYGASHWTISGNTISQSATEPGQPYHKLCARGPAGAHAAAIIICEDTDQNDLSSDHNIVELNKISSYYGILVSVAYPGQIAAHVPHDNRFSRNDVKGSNIGCADNSRSELWQPKDDTWTDNNCDDSPN